MYPTTHLLLTASLLAAQVPSLVQPNVRPLAAGERAALRQLDDPTLAGQSAGRSAPVNDLDEATRSELRRLQSEDRTLAEQRAGEMDNNTLMTILIVLAIVALVIIIL